MKPLLDRLRGARHIELYIALILVSVLALALMGVRGVESTSSGSNTLERRLERLLSQIERAGRVSVMITEGEDGHITGVVIVARRLDGVRPALEIQSAVKTLLGVEGDQVRIIGRDQSYGGALQ